MATPHPEETIDFAEAAAPADVADPAAERAPGFADGQALDNAAFNWLLRKSARFEAFLRDHMVPRFATITEAIDDGDAAVNPPPYVAALEPGESCIVEDYNPAVGRFGASVTLSRVGAGVADLATDGQAVIVAEGTNLHAFDPSMSYPPSRWTNAGTAYDYVDTAGGNVFATQGLNTYGFDRDTGAAIAGSPVTWAGSMTAIKGMRCNGTHVGEILANAAGDMVAVTSSALTGSASAAEAGQTKHVLAMTGNRIITGGDKATDTYRVHGYDLALAKVWTWNPPDSASTPDVFGIECDGDLVFVGHDADDNGNTLTAIANDGDPSTSVSWSVWSINIGTDVDYLAVDERYLYAGRRVGGPATRFYVIDKFTGAIVRVDSYAFDVSALRCDGSRIYLADDNGAALHVERLARNEGPRVWRRHDPANPHRLPFQTLLTPNP